MAKIKNMGTATMKFGEGLIVTGSYVDDDTSLTVSGSIKIGLGTNDFTLPFVDGNDKQVLTTNGNGAVTWEDVESGGDAFIRTVSKPTANFSADPTAYSVFAVDCNGGNVTATLPTPSAPNEGLQVTFIKNAGGNTLTITAGNNNIWRKGTTMTNYDITDHGKNVTLICISYAWIIIAEN
jgi:hypothetical protein